MDLSHTNRAGAARTMLRNALEPLQCASNLLDDAFEDVNVVGPGGGEHVVVLDDDARRAR